MQRWADVNSQLVAWARKHAHGLLRLLLLSCCSLRFFRVIGTDGLSGESFFVLRTEELVDPDSVPRLVSFDLRSTQSHPHLAHTRHARSPP